MYEEAGMARVLIGTSGWAYARWKGCFYPPRLPEKQRLSFYADRFPTTEINCSFYRIPSEDTYRKWATLVPSGFTFAVKANRIISHAGRLRNIQDTWQMFVRGVRNLGDSAGPVLVQLPPSFGLDLSCL